MHGFDLALTANNLLFCLIGVTVGQFVGVLPGLGPVAGTAMLIPLTYALSPTTAVIMLAGIFYGAMYGGTDHLGADQRAGRGSLGDHVRWTVTRWPSRGVGAMRSASPP